MTTSVPASGHTALLRHGLIPDPYQGDNEASVEWAHRAAWRFVRPLPETSSATGGRVDLVFEGLDTVAEVRVGGQPVAQSRNMHRMLRVPLTDAQRDARELEVDFGSALDLAESEARRLGTRPAAYPHPYYMVRKMAASFGWDWGPDLQAAGIWRPVRLESWSTARIAELRPEVRQGEDGTWEVTVYVSLERVDQKPLRIRSSVKGPNVRTFTEIALPGDSSHGVLTLTADNPLPWATHDRGQQTLYDLRIELYSDSELLDTASRRIGFRTVQVRNERDDFGTEFCLVLNGEPMFARGFNWIPDDHLVDRVTYRQLRERLMQARDAHANVIRVWGGGIYESDAFYDICDELGLLVWQDIAMACAGYPEQEPLLEEITAEVRENAVRLACHPSLALWCGGNENAWGHPQWQERGDIDDVTDWGARYIYDVLPAALSAIDPTRPYISNSPFSPRDAKGDERWPNAPEHGVYHEWDVWNQKDYTAYRDVSPRFCAEFGYQAPPNRAVLDTHLRTADSPVILDSPAFTTHQKAEDGAGKLARGMSPHLGAPEDVDDWHVATQMMQALAIRCAVEHYRSDWPLTAGAIIWQLNDCWPAVSWSAIDSSGSPKPMWHAARKAFADRIVTWKEGIDRGELAFVNDTAEEWITDVQLRRETLDGVLLAEESSSIRLAPRTVGRVHMPTSVLSDVDPAEEIVVVQSDLGRAPFLLTEPRAVRWRPDAVDVEVVAHSEGWQVEVTARSAVFGLSLLADLVASDARVDDAMIDLAAGGRATFVVRTSRRDLDPSRFAAPPVLRWFGELLARESSTREDR